jgi:competence protein ComEA
LVGLTETEIKVLLFLISVFCFGLIAKQFFSEDNIELKAEYDYSKSDSAFNSANSKVKISKETSISGEKNVASEQELLDFSTNNLLNNSSKKSALSEKSIDINTADIKQLILLPGIGEKTAEKIISLRKNRGRFYSINELLDIKGIGSKKLNKIKKYIFLSN